MRLTCGSGSTIEQTLTISGNLGKRDNDTRLRFSEGGFLTSDRTTQLIGGEVSHCSSGRVEFDAAIVTRF